MRGAWIEILDDGRRADGQSRSPCGERGLKYNIASYKKRDAVSLPVRGAWIEIDSLQPPLHSLSRRSPCGERGLKSYVHMLSPTHPMSLPVRGAWIEISVTVMLVTLTLRSLPVRGAWIEIQKWMENPPNIGVAPRAGSVD